MYESNILYHSNDMFLLCTFDTLFSIIIYSCYKLLGGRVGHESKSRFRIYTQCNLPYIADFIHCIYNGCYGSDACNMPFTKRIALICPLTGQQLDFEDGSILYFIIVTGRKCEVFQCKTFSAFSNCNLIYSLQFEVPIGQF